MAESRSCLHRTDPLTDLLYLEQTGNVQEFYNSFNLLQSAVTISEDIVLEVFLRGLKSEIEKYVRLFNPRILKDAYFWARLKELTIPVSGVKEDVVVDEIGAESGLESAKKVSENAVVPKVFDEMLEKDMGDVSDANMLIEILPSPYILEFVNEGEHLMYEGGGNKNDMHIDSQVAFRKIATRLCHGDNLVTKETTHSVNWPQRYPSKQKCNLRLGRDREAVYCQGGLCLIFSSMNLEDKVL